MSKQGPEKPEPGFKDPSLSPTKFPYLETAAYARIAKSVGNHKVHDIVVDDPQRSRILESVKNCKKKDRK